MDSTSLVENLRREAKEPASHGKQTTFVARGGPGMLSGVGVGTGVVSVVVPAR